MALEFNVDSVLQALDALYNNPNTQIISQANTYLDSFQKTSYAWSISHDLLSHPGRTEQSYYFAAQTLKTKIMSRFHELPVQQLPDFKDVLIAHLTHFSNGPQSVRNMLSNALACLVVQYVGWSNSIDQIFSEFSKPDYILTLLTVLTIIPEMFYDPKINCTSRVLREQAHHISTFNRRVFQLLFNCIQQENIDLNTQQKILRCLVNWIGIGEIPVELSSTPLIPFAFNTLLNPAMFDVSVDCICEILRVSEAFQSDENMLSLMGVLYNQTLALGPIFNQLSKPDSDLDLLRGFTQIFTELGESSLYFIITTESNQINQLLELIILCSSHPHPEVSNLCFRFWYRLSEDICRQSTEIKNQAINRLAPLFQQYFNILLVANRFPPNYPSLDDEQKEDIRSYRHLCSEAFGDIAMVTGIESCLSLLHTAISTEINIIQTNINQWQGLESCLYAFRFLARFINRQENNYVPIIIQLIPHIPPVSMLQHTALLVIGRYSSWLNQHVTHFNLSLQYVISNIYQLEISTASCIAFRLLCDGCVEHFVNHIENLFQLFEKCFNLPLENQLEIINGITKVIANLGNSTLEALQRLLFPIIQELQSILSHNFNEIATGHKHQSQRTLSLSRVFDKLGTVCRNMVISNLPPNYPHPLITIFQQNWVFLQQTFYQLKGDDNAMEKYCKCWKLIMRTAQAHFEPLLKPLLETVINLFNSSPEHSCLIYMGSIAIDVFGRMPEYANLIQQILYSFASSVLKLLPDLNGFTNNPDVTEDFFDAMNRIIRRCPHILIQSEFIEPIFYSALQGILVQQKEALVSVAVWMENFIFEGLGHSGRDGSVEVQQLVIKYGQQLVTQIFYGISGALPTNRIKDIIPIYEALLKLTPQCTKDWSINSIQQINTITLEQKTNFLETFFSTSPHDDRKRAECFYELEALCQGRMFLATNDND